MEIVTVVPCVGSCAAAAIGEAVSERSPQLIAPAENTAAAECMNATGATTLEGLPSVLDGRWEAALAEPVPARAAGAGHERGQPAGT